LFQHLNSLIPKRKAGIWAIYNGYRHKQLGYHKARNFYQFMWTKSHYSSTARSWSCKEYSYAEINFQVENVPHPARQESGTSKPAFRFFLAD